MIDYLVVVVILLVLFVFLFVFVGLFWVWAVYFSFTGFPGCLVVDGVCVYVWLL